MNLPDLPKINKRAEADFGTYTFLPWLLKVHRQDGIYELKVAGKNNRLPFSAVVTHQIQTLELVRHGVFVYKPPDMGQRNPGDYICMVRKPAWIVVKYDSHFVMITIDNFNAERFKSKSKSLSFERAKEIATHVI